MGTFWTLFRHIKKNDISMTAPVEMTMGDGEDGTLAQEDMAFLYASTSLGRTGRDGAVEVVDLEPVTVLSVAMTGPVSEARVRVAKTAIEAALARDAGWSVAGKWRLLGYNSPMVPAKKRLYELQLPVRPTSDR